MSHHVDDLMQRINSMPVAQLAKVGGQIPAIMAAAQRMDDYEDLGILELEAYANDDPYLEVE